MASGMNDGDLHDDEARHRDTEWNDHTDALEHVGSYDPETVRRLFEMQPDNRLTPAQMVRRSLFPRWEILSPAPYNPVDAENCRIAEILSQEHPDA